MSVPAEVVPPVTYSPIWMIVGSICIMLCCGWVALILYTTRKKPLPTLATAPMRQAYQVDLVALKNRYYALLSTVELEYSQSKITSRTAHEKLSYIARYFVYEASGRPTHRLTAKDLEKSKFKDLASIIRGIYPPEFAKMQAGNVTESSASIRRMIEQWA